MSKTLIQQLQSQISLLKLYINHKSIKFQSPTSNKLVPNLNALNKHRFLRCFRRFLSLWDHRRFPGHRSGAVSTSGQDGGSGTAAGGFGVHGPGGQRSTTWRSGAGGTFGSNFWNNFWLLVGVVDFGWFLNFRKSKKTSWSLQERRVD